MSATDQFGVLRQCADGRQVWVPVGSSLDTVCALGFSPVDPNAPGPNEPEITLQPAVTQGTGTMPPTGLDPAAPGGPGQSKAWGAELLAWIFGDDEPLPMNEPAPAGCCPESQPRCLKCWLRENVRWLLLIALVGAVLWFKRKP